MPTKPGPPRIFLSYAHEDRQHRETLTKNLAALKHSGRAFVWYDGMIEPGKDWEPAIYRELDRSDIFVALVTKNFFGSAYCIEHELEYARKLEQEGKCDLLPVLADSCDIDAHWLGKKQRLPARPVNRYHPSSIGWTLVAQGIRNKLDTLEKNRVVSVNMDCREEMGHSGQLPIQEDTRTGAATFQNVSAFWRDRGQLENLRLATVTGTLSRFAPLIVGSPKAKARLHKEFRQKIETNRSFGNLKSFTIDACMSMSAGQMVARERLGNKPKLLLGLYSSIVRNSIPVFVKREYFERVVEPLLLRSGGCEGFEAIVTGRVFSLKNYFVRRYLNRQGLTEILTTEKVDDLCHNAFALEVGDEGTGITALPGPPHYVDGDIWLAIRKPDGSERFLTSFVDITNAHERAEELELLSKQAGEHGLRKL